MIVKIIRRLVRHRPVGAVSDVEHSAGADFRVPSEIFRGSPWLLHVYAEAAGFHRCPADLLCAAGMIDRGGEGIKFFKRDCQPILICQFFCLCAQSEIHIFQDIICFCSQCKSNFTLSRRNAKIPAAFLYADDCAEARRGFFIYFSA